MLSFTIQKRLAVLVTSLTVAAAPAMGVAQGPLILDEDGLSGITATTPFDIFALRKIISNVTWEAVDRPTEDGTEPLIVATRRGKTGFVVSGDGRGRVAAIEIVSRRVDNRLGPRVGDSHRSLARNGNLGACWPGLEATAGSVLCEAAETPRITYVFSGRWNGPDDQMPPAAVLNGWSISQMIWRPDRFAQIGKPQIQASEATPAFDCKRASASVEKLICGSPELARLDRQLNDAYAERLAAARPKQRRLLRAEQRGWIKGRNDCWKSSNAHQCVLDVYKDRIREMTASDTPLRDTSWIGVRIAGDTIPRTIDINLTFGADGRVTGLSACNRFSANYALDGRNLTIDMIGGTRRLCPEIEMVAERRFLDALGKVDGWAMRNEELILFGTGAELTFRRL